MKFLYLANLIEILYNNMYDLIYNKLTPSIMQTIKKILYFLTLKERKRAILLLIMVMTMALLDMLGVASIVPFMAVLTNPSLIESNAILSSMFKTLSVFGIETNQQFLSALGFIVFVLLITTITFKAFTNYAKLRFITMQSYRISKRLAESYLYQPYSWFLHRHSADLGKSILSEVGMLVSNGLSPIINLMSQSMVVIALLTLLIINDPKLALTIFIILAVTYSLIYKSVRSLLNRIGEERLKANQLRFMAISEAFGASKEIKVAGLEQNYIKKISKPSEVFALRQATSEIISQLPRFALEAIAFGGLLLVILYLMAKSGTFLNAVPTIALYVFAGYRLMPALQELYHSFTQLRFGKPAIDALYDDCKNLKPFNLNQDQGVLTFNKTITLKHIHYNYPNASRTALNDINLTIPFRSTVGIVGATGSGKTTTVDIILGLLNTQKGTLEIDGQVITKNNCRAWQRSIGYVTQQIYLADDSVAANIAFGIDLKDINQKAVEYAAKIANLDDFVINELPRQYQTNIGERGVRLSGGQRQRIGIARALYHNPKLLILDEATSSLDNLTEKAVMEAVSNLSKEITIIMIAHRLSTVKKCDMIFYLEKGKLINEGTFEELIKANDNFRATAESL